MKKTKIVSMLLAISIATAMFAGCSGGEAPKETGNPSSQDGTETNAPKTHNLKILGVETAQPFSWDEREEYSAWKILQSKFDEAGLNIEWETVADEQYQVILQTRIASGKDLPDLVKVHKLDNAAVLSLAKQGIILPINEMIEKYGNGTVKKAFDETYPTVRPLTTAEDGNMYWFSNTSTKFYEKEKNTDGTFTVMYRKDWADKLSIKEPTNINEFTQMLKDFRTKDANGTGKADEILFVDISSFRTSIAQWFDLATNTVAIDPYNKKAVTPWKQANVKAYFTYLNNLVKEGIIDPSVAGNYEIMAQKMAENKIAALWDYSNAGWNEPQVAAVAPDALFAPLMPLQAVEGVTPAGMSEPGSLVWEKYAVTKACTDQEGIMKLMDIVYSDEYSLLATFGEEGKNFTYVDGVITPVAGLTQDKILEQKIPEGNIIWPGVLPRVQNIDMRQQVAGVDEYKSKVTLDMLKYPKRYPDQIDNFLAMPTDAETARINELLTNVNTASKELATKLSLGKISIDSLDAEVAKLDKLGLSELVEITQARYDRYLANLPK